MVCECTDFMGIPALTPEEFQYYAVKFQDGQPGPHHRFAVHRLGQLDQAVAVLVVDGHANVQR